MDDIRQLVGEPTDVHRNETFTILLVGRSHYSMRRNFESMKKMLWKFPTIKIFTVVFGEALTGFRPDLIVLMDEARSGRELDWLDGVLRPRMGRHTGWMEA